ncbi:MAG: PAS domain S-box protein [Acidobacteriaceae bacterium]|nr:PAS domain S-box protein [Acidobacteriaceae bacterium]
MPQGWEESLSTAEISDHGESSADWLRGRVAELEALVEDLRGRVSGYENVFLTYPIPGIVYSADSFKILDANQAAVTLYGRSRREMRNLSVLDLFSPQPAFDRELLLKELRKATNSIGPVVHRGADKQEVVVSLISCPFELQGSEVRVLLIHDETLRRTTEEALRASEERYRELFENANDVILLHDLKGKILALNRAAEHLTGYSRSEVLGRSFEQLVAPGARGQVLDIIRAHLGGSNSQHDELPILTKTGVVRYVEVSSRVIYRKGHPVGVQSIARDITDRKQAQQRLLESARALQQKNEELSTALRLAREATLLKEQFLANTSHELRTPMNGIMGMISLLRSTELTADQREYADAVSQCANDLLTIINDLLDLSQIDAGRLSITSAPFDVHESLKAVVKLLRLRATAKNLPLTFEIDPALPSIVYGDSVRFRQILTNLIANAIKFTFTGGVHIHLRVAENSNFMRCEVIDSGIGVDESVSERIFEAFFQADGTTRRRFGGTGLGLAICKQLVNIMGGRIGTFNNQPEPGATFWFEVPLCSEGDAPTAQEQGSPGLRQDVV